MGQPVSKIDVCNMALDYCGQASVQNIDSPTTATESLLSRHYDNVRRTVLRKYTCWNFAVGQATLSRIGTPPFDWTDQYQLPSDFLRLMEPSFPTGIAPIPPVNVHQPFKISGKTILMNNNNANSLNVYYLRDVQDPSQWDDAFLKVVVLELAVTICYQLTKQAKLVGELNGMLMAEIADAISVDGQEVPPWRKELSKAVTGRMMSYTNAFAAPWTEID